MTWEELGPIARELPGVEGSTSYGTPAFKAGKVLLARLKEDGRSVVLPVDMDEKERLIEVAPQVFFQTDHYRGHPYVLARLEVLEAADLRRILQAVFVAQAPRRVVAEWERARRGGARNG